jgi:hypothetical protein
MGAPYTDDKTVTVGSANMRGWRRVGIVLSVFWFVGFGWWLRQAELDDARYFAGYSICDADIIKDKLDCLNRAGETYIALYPPLWGTILVDALSIGALWLLAWLAVVVGRWVAAGFREQA